MHYITLGTVAPITPSLISSKGPGCASIARESSSSNPSVWEKDKTSLQALYELNLMLTCYPKCSTHFHQPHRQLGSSPGVHWLSIQTTSCHYLCAAHGSHHHGVTSAHQSDLHCSHTGSQPGKKCTGVQPCTK